MAGERMFDGTASSLGSDPFGLAGVLELLDKVAAVDPSPESDEALMTAAAALEVARDRLDATEERILARLESTGATDAQVGMATSGWLAWESDTNLPRCRARVKMARRLCWFGEFSQALADGLVRVAHLEVLAEVANPRNRDDLAELQAVLIDLAGRYRLREWSALVRQLASDLDSDGAFDPAVDPSRNRLRIGDNRDGTVSIKGVLNGVAAVTVTQGLEAMADELFRRYSADLESDPELAMPSRAQLLAEALAEALRRAAAVDLDSTRAPRVEATIVIEGEPTDTVSTDTVATDTVSTDTVSTDTVSTDTVNAAPRSSHDSGGGVGSPGGDAADRTARVRITDLHGRVVSDCAAETLLVDPDLRALLMSSAGDPLWMGSKVRLATQAQRHALAIRDGGCIFPGCDMPPAWCDAHHQPAWKPTGSTDIDKMFLACRRHHGVTHRNGWTCSEDPDRPQHWIWTTPAGRTLHSHRQRRRPV